MNIFHDDGHIQTMQGIDANLPQASAYIFSVITSGLSRSQSRRKVSHLDMSIPVKDFVCLNTAIFIG